jgi:hypothetical protein
MKLRKQDQEFRNARVFYPDPKNIDLDRVLINLFLLLRCDGTRPATRGRPKAEFEQVGAHVNALASMTGVQGIEENREIAQQWLETDIFDLVNRDRPTEANALRPARLQRASFRIEFHTPDLFNFDDVFRAQLADFRDPRSRIGTNPRHPTSNRVIFGQRGSENDLLALADEFAQVFRHSFSEPKHSAEGMLKGS